MKRKSKAFKGGLSQGVLNVFSYHLKFHRSEMGENLNKKQIIPKDFFFSYFNLIIFFTRIESLLLSSPHLNWNHPSTQTEWNAQEKGTPIIISWTRARIYILYNMYILYYSLYTSAVEYHKLILLARREATL